MTLTTNWQTVGTYRFQPGTGLIVDFYLDAKYSTQSKTDNSTTVQTRLRSVIVSGYGNGTGYNFTLTYATTLSGSSMWYIETETIMNGNSVVKHNENGTKSITLSATMRINGAGLNGSIQVNVDLPTIQRYAMITSTDNFTDEGNPKVKFTNSGLYSLVGKIVVEKETITTKDIPNGSTEYTFELTQSERNRLRELAKSKTLNVTLSISSLSGSNTLYTSSVTTLMSIVNAEPTFTYTMIETNSNVETILNKSTAESLIKNASKVKITINPTTYKYASVAGINVTNSGITYSVTAYPYEVIVPIVDNTFTISVIDSRGYTTSKVDSNRTLIDYEPVKFNNFTFTRENATSSNIILNFDCTYYDAIGKYSNINRTEIKWKLDDGNFVNIPTDACYIDSKNHKITLNRYVLSNALIYTKSGQFTLYIRDSLSETQDSGQDGLVSKGVATYEAGEHDLQINGDLFIADINRENVKNIKDLILSNSTIEKDNNRMAIKFENGLLINMIRTNIMATINNAWGSVYTSSEILSMNQDYLVPFTEIYNIQMEGRSLTYNSWIMIVEGFESLTTPPRFNLIRGTSGTSESMVYCYAIGLWK